MEITTPVSSLLSRKSGQIWSISPEVTVFEAISLMAEKNIGALPVLGDGRLLGIISERDYTRKVILHGRVSRETRVGEIMAVDLVTVTPSDSVQKCLRLITENHVRHLPVIEGDRMVGLLSIGDLVNWTIATQKSAIEDLTNFVTGAYPA